MDKSPDAFRTISEVAVHLETPAHVLRFWESRFPQIRPVKRAGGRRYYRPSDVSLLTGIKRLLHDEGMTIRGVQKILREQGVRHVAGLSGEGIDDEGVASAPFVELTDDPIEDVVVTLRTEPGRPRPVPGLTEAMAKAVDHGQEQTSMVPAPSTAVPEPEPEPVQGALLLTPAPPAKPAPDAVADAPEARDDIAGTVHAVVQNDAAEAADASAEQAGAPTAPQQDFDEDDDADDGPVTTLAARIRSLPSDASAERVRDELQAVAARLQALRDRMADAVHPGRS